MKKCIISHLTFVALLGLAACDQGTANEPQTATNQIIEVTPEQASERYADAVFVDVRSDAEWNAGHLANALHLPMSELQANAENVLGKPNKTVVLYCKSGGRAGRASRHLQELGYQTIVVTDGGYAELKAAGLK